MLYNPQLSWVLWLVIIFGLYDPQSFLFCFMKNPQSSWALWIMTHNLLGLYHPLPFFFFFFLIIKTRLYWNIKILYNPTKRETKSYIEGSKSDIRHGQRPYREGSKIVQQKGNTKFDHNLEDYKSNHNKWCPEQQKVWSLDPNQANHEEVESNLPWQEMLCDSGVVGALQKEEFWRIYPKGRVIDRNSNWKRSPNPMPTKHPQL